MKRSDIDKLSSVELETLIIKASQDYYLGMVSMDDILFDYCLDKLESINAKSEVLKGVGFGISVYGEKIKLPCTIRESLPKVKDFKDVHKDWDLYILSQKADGMSCILEYENGSLILAATRGDGEYGVNIMEKVKLIPGIPKTVDDKGKYEIRGELIILNSVFTKDLSDEYATPRHAVSGIINAKSLDKVEYVTFVAHEKTPITDKFGMKSLTPWTVRVENLEEKLRTVWKSDSDIPVDGVVYVNANNKDQAYAFKFETETTETTVTQVEWNSHKGGKLIPIIHYETVELYGTNCSKCSGFNYKFISDNKIGVGSKILLTKGNEIIPYIVEVISGIEENCTPWPWQNFKVDGVHAYSNNHNTGAESLRYFMKTYYTYDGFKSFDKLQEIFNIYTYEDLVKVRELDDQEILDKLKANSLISSANTLLSVLKNKTISGSIIFSSLGFHGVGRTATASLKHFYHDYIKAITLGTDLDVDEIVSSSGVNITVEKVLQDKEYQDILLFVNENWDVIITEEFDEDSGEDLPKFIITGKMPSGMTKKQVEQKVRGKATMVNNLSDADFLVIDNITSQSSKVKNARKRDMIILTEKQFYDRVL